MTVPIFGVSALKKNVTEYDMADFGSLLKGVVSGAVNSGSDGELDISRISGVLQKILGSKSVLEAALGTSGTDIVSAASDVKSSIDSEKGMDMIKTGLSALKTALSKVKGNALCATLLQSLEALGA